ncbi:MAG: UDP-N-acetylmuramoyl-tripeptide--D-alanyl-D-alanine ligase [Ignavibacteria bacterium]|nr:UDP-N-acetylmuramoyl-tripeptide--D-alanyl-D-alanine ligase [Ignavibacteria bacterium]
MKSIRLNIEDIFNLPSAVIYNPDDLKPVSDITIDSRSVKKKSLFIAIKGKKFDGHNFIKEAVTKGASAVLVNTNKYRKYNDLDVPIITVANTTKALGSIANIWRKKLSTKIIGITGSTGKTTTKDMLATILAEKYKVSKTYSNNNNHIGVPLTILSTTNKHEMLVAELGTNHYKEIKYTAGILEPDYGMILNIGNSHLEYLKNRAGVWKEKSALFYETIKNNGKVFINNDDPITKRFAGKSNNQVTYGFSGRVDLKAKIKKYSADGKPVIEIKYRNKQFTEKLNFYGEQSANNYIAAVAVAFELGLTKSQILSGTKKIKATPQRLNVKHYKNFFLIDDTYNANPDSTKRAIDLVGKISLFDNKILILGDMLELGKNKIELHKKLSAVIRKNKIDELFTIGPAMKHISDYLRDKRVLRKHFRTRKSLMNFIAKKDFNNSVVLVKGSRGMCMEEFVVALKNSNH